MSWEEEQAQKRAAIKRGDFQISVPRIPLFDDMAQLYLRPSIAKVVPFLETFKKVQMDAKRVLSDSSHPARQFVFEREFIDGGSTLNQSPDKHVQQIVTQLPQADKDSGYSFIQFLSQVKDLSEPDEEEVSVSKWKFWRTDKIEKVPVIRHRKVSDLSAIRFLWADSRIGPQLEDKTLEKWWNMNFGTPVASFEWAAFQTQEAIKGAFFQSWHFELDQQMDLVKLGYHSADMHVFKDLRVERRSSSGRSSDGILIDLQSGDTEAIYWDNNTVGRRNFQLQEGELVENKSDKTGVQIEDLVVDILTKIPVDVTQENAAQTHSHS